jgi:hypothetical protein
MPKRSLIETEKETQSLYKGARQPSILHGVQVFAQFDVNPFVSPLDLNYNNMQPGTDVSCSTT